MGQTKEIKTNWQTKTISLIKYLDVLYKLPDNTMHSLMMFSIEKRKCVYQKPTKYENHINLHHYFIQILI